MSLMKMTSDICVFNQKKKLFLSDIYKSHRTLFLTFFPIISFELLYSINIKLDHVKAFIKGSQADYLGNLQAKQYVCSS